MKITKNKFILEDSEYDRNALSRARAVIAKAEGLG